MPPIINASVCNGCGSCVRECFTGVLVATDNGIPTIRPDMAEYCIDCGHCTAVCPRQACLPKGQDAHLDRVPAVGLDEAQRRMLFAGRRSIRQFKPDRVDDGLLMQAIDLAKYAPTAGNMREVGFTVLNGRDKITPILDELGIMLGDHREFDYHTHELQNGRDTIFRGAPCLICVHTTEWFWAETDCVIATATLQLSLHSLGLGSCWSGILAHAAMFGQLKSIPLPEEHNLYAALMVGHPAVDFVGIPKREAYIAFK